jgi:4-hydroxy 2-oxovalerate aldolase
MKIIEISDPTLRDGNHAVAHQLSAEHVAYYCAAADKAGVPIVEVGHGNGLGASSLQLGLAALSDRETLQVARAHLKRSLLGVHVIPGFATIAKDLAPALDLGVDVVRVATHCSEADLSQRHLTFVRKAGKRALGVLMMSHRLAAQALKAEALKMQDYGAQGLIMMDSAGAYLPSDVSLRVKTLVEALSIPIGFHAHNNLGLAIANSLAAVDAGATLLDGCARGFGAGAGNTQLEVLVPLLGRLGYQTGIDFNLLLDAAQGAEALFIKQLPTISNESIISGLSGIFSGFLKPVKRIAKDLNLNPSDIYRELNRRQIVAGQEDMILEIAEQLAREKA